MWETAARWLNLPVLVIRVAVCQETGDSLGHFLVGQDVPQAVGSQHQDVVGSMLALRQRVDFDLKRRRRRREGQMLKNVLLLNPEDFIYLHL